MRKKCLSLALALVPLFPLAVPPTVQAETITLASSAGSGCTVNKIHGAGRWGKEWDWVRIECGQIINAEYARGKIVCDWAPDRYTSWAQSYESFESGGCPFSSGAVTVEYADTI